MNLVIDIGNTRIKLALFNEHDLLFTVPTDDLKVDHLQLLVDEHPQIKRAILSSVRNYPENIRQFLQTSFDQFIELNHETPVPLINLYKTPETLGLDRLAAAVGASVLFPGRNLMVIDAGTAITYDFVTDKHEYLGGNISPGLTTRFRSLHHFTGRLPLVDAKDSFQYQGNDTETAIRAGVQLGMIFEADQYISYFNTIYKNLKVIITGGDAIFFERNLKNPIFVHFNLNVFGLNRILEFNE